MSTSNIQHEAHDHGFQDQHQPTNLSLSHIEALLFDLGGVIIDIDFEPTLQAWAQFSPLTLAEIRTRMSMDAVYQQHERGEIESVVYFQHIRNLFELDATDEEIERGWNAIFVGEFTQTIEAIFAVRDQVRCFAFSNTNASHQKAWEGRYTHALSAFERVFVSSELGLRKPDRAAFEAIERETGIELSKILFFDDSAENIAGARAAGLQAVWVQTPNDVINALHQLLA